MKRIFNFAFVAINIIKHDDPKDQFQNKLILNPHHYYTFVFVVASKSMTMRFYCAWHCALCKPFCILIRLTL